MSDYFNLVTFEDIDWTDVRVAPRCRLIAAPFTSGAERLTTLLDKFGVQVSLFALPEYAMPEADEEDNQLRQRVWDSLLQSKRRLLFVTQEPHTAFLGDSQAPEDIFGLPPAETWAYHALFWSTVLPQNTLHVVRLEEISPDAIGLLRNILRGLEVWASEPDIATVLQNSVKETDLSLSPLPDREYTFSPVVTAAMLQLGYAVPGAAQSAFIAPTHAHLIAGVDAAGNMALADAQLALAMGEPAKAEATLRALLADGPPSLLNRFVLGNTLLALRWTRAIFGDLAVKTPAAQQAFTLFRDWNYQTLPVPALLRQIMGESGAHDDAIAYTGLGEALYELGMPDAAEAVFLAARALAPNSAVIYNNLAAICWERSDIDAAVAHIETAYRLDPANPDVVGNFTAMRAALGLAA